MNTTANTFAPRPRSYWGRDELRNRPLFKSTQRRIRTPTPSLYDTASFKHTITPLDDKHTLRIGVTDDQGHRSEISPAVHRAAVNQAPRNQAPRNQAPRNRASRARGNESSRSSYAPFRRETKSTSTLLNGTASRKRRIDDTEFDRVAAKTGPYSVVCSIVTSPGRQSDPEEEIDPINSTLPMLGAISFIGSFGRMIFDFGANLGATFTGLKETWRRYRTGNPYTIAEFRSYINNNQISNKRIKLDHDDDTYQVPDHQEPVQDDGLLRWASADELLPLKTQFTTLESRLRITSQLITDFPSRQSMHKVLEPIADVLNENQDELALSSTDDHNDLCKLFHLRWQETFDLLRQLYDVELMVRIRNKFKFVPQELDLCHAQAQANLARRARQLLSTPTMIATCNQVLRLAQDPSFELGALELNRSLSQSFIDRVVLDLNAVLRKLPPPSYVKNEEYRAKLERMFSRGGDLPSLPGAFPGLDQPAKIAQESSWEPSSIPLPPSPSPPTTTPNLNEEEAFHLIRDSYVNDAYTKSPLDPASFVTVKSILKKKLRDGSSPFSPKRLARRCAKAVRFTSDTLSPRPRSHSGSELNQVRRKPTAGLNRPFRPSVILQPPKDSIFRHTFEFPIRPSPVKVDHDAKIREILSTSSLDLELSDTSRAGIEAHKKEEQRRIAEEARRVAEEQRRVAEEKARKERAERLSKSGGLRVPRCPFVEPLAPEWDHRARNTVRAADTAVLAKTGEGADLRRHDFLKVVNPTEWLNDEIVNGALNFLDQAINSAAGIKDVKKATRKCWAPSSFFFKRLQDQGVKNTQRTLRRSGVDKANFLDIDTILLPICERSHWTLLVVRPSKRTVAHMDSLEPAGSRAYVSLAVAWIKDVLDDKFQADEWKVLRYDAPRQTNGYDCGVHTVTNGMCLALGLSPLDCYSAAQMPLQRLRIAAVLLNGGFTGDFDLRVY